MPGTTVRNVPLTIRALRLIQSIELEINTVIHIANTQLSALQTLHIAATGGDGDLRALESAFSRIRSTRRRINI